MIAAINSLLKLLSKVFTSLNTLSYDYFPPFSLPLGNWFCHLDPIFLHTHSRSRSPFDFAAECFPLSDAVSLAFKISSSDKSLPFCWMWCLVIANDTDTPITDPPGWWRARPTRHRPGDSICILIVLLLTGMYKFHAVWKLPKMYHVCHCQLSSIVFATFWVHAFLCACFLSACLRVRFIARTLFRAHAFPSTRFSDRTLFWPHASQVRYSAQTLCAHKLVCNLLKWN